MDFSINDLNLDDFFVKTFEYDPDEVDLACTAFMGAYLLNFNPEMHTTDEGTVILTVTLKEK